MLYICIFSNKFDLIQAIRVSHIVNNFHSSVCSSAECQCPDCHGAKIKNCYFKSCFARTLGYKMSFRWFLFNFHW
jgi:hypothetical protein